VNYGEGIADLREGDGVEFDVTDSPKGPRAVDVKRTTTKEVSARSALSRTAIQDYGHAI